MNLCGSQLVSGFESEGIMRYSPEALGSHSQNWWLVIDCDPAIGDYFRHLYAMFHSWCRRLTRPAWKEHITLIRNEEPPKKHQWRKYEGTKVSFFCVPEVKTNGQYYWLEVFMPEVGFMREELGLPSEPKIPLHLSVGHDEYYKQLQKKLGFVECFACGAQQRERTLVCHECGYKVGL